MPVYKIPNTKNKEGKAQYRVRVNYTDSYGNHKQYTRLVWGRNEAKELEKKLSLQSDNNVSVKLITVNTLYTEYISNIQYEVRASTLQKKEDYYTNHIKPFLGNKKLSQLDARLLTSWKQYENEKPLRTRTKQNAFAELRALLNYAVKMDYIPSNPLNKVSNFRDPYAAKEEISFYTPEEFTLYKTAALQTANDTGYYDYYVFFCIAYYTGARKGEIHALRWNCITGDYLDIKKSISQKTTRADSETPPKNKSSIRTVQIPAPLMNILREHKTRQKAAVTAMGHKWSPEGFICGYYKPLRDSSIDNENRKYAAAANLKRIRIHDFRHSHASLLINNGINALEVAHRLGHSTVEQTLKTYAHLFPKESEKAIEILNKI